MFFKKSLCFSIVFINIFSMPFRHSMGWVKKAGKFVWDTADGVNSENQRLNKELLENTANLVNGAKQTLSDKKNSLKLKAKQTVSDYGQAALNATAEGVKSGTSLVVDNVAEVFKKTFEVGQNGQPSGAAAAALDNAFKAIEHQFKDGGAVPGILDSTLKNVADQFDGNGQGARLTKQAFETLSKEAASSFGYF